MTQIIGIDPGITKCAIAIWDGKTIETSEFEPSVLTNWIVDWIANAGIPTSPFSGDCIVIMEKPVPQGARSSRNSTFELVRVADRIVQAALAAGAEVYAVPVNVIRRQAGYTTACGKGDDWVKRYLRFAPELSEVVRNAQKRGGLLSNADKRDAAMCAFWNYKHVENQVYKEAK